VWIGRVVFESDISSLSLPYYEGVSHVVTHDDLIATEAQREPAACAGDQGGRCYGIIGKSVRSHTPQV
jgi:hypothetical protein